MHLHRLKVGQPRHVAVSVTLGVAIAMTLSGVAAATPLWGNPVVVAGAFNNGPLPEVNSISCAHAGDCSAGGAYGLPTTSETHSGAFAVTETTGTWHPAVKLAAALDAAHTGALNVVSCSSPGNCGAGGSYGNASGSHGFVVSQTAGAWGTAFPIGHLGSTTSASVSGMSCKGTGDCTAIGNFETATSAGAFVTTESAGHWSVPRIVHAFNSSSVSLLGVSCAKPGDCSVGGDYEVGPSAAMKYEAFVINQVNGKWQAPKEVAANINIHNKGYVGSLSCTKPGYCGAVGEDWGANGPQGFTIGEVAGVWGSAAEVKGSPPDGNRSGAGADAISCVKPGYCTAGGNANYSGGDKAYVVTETAGVWGTLLLVAQNLNTLPNGAVEGLSCASPGNCVGVGYYQYNVRLNSYDEDFVITEAAGVWGPAFNLRGTAPNHDSNSTNSVSCPTASFCGIGGQLTRGGKLRAFVSTT